MISIIIPAFNAADTIVEALESVLAQSLWAGSAEHRAPSAEGERGRSQEHGAPSAEGERGRSQEHGAPSAEDSALQAPNSPLYEVIIVDDASTDNTVEVVERWIRERAEGRDQRAEIRNLASDKEEKKSVSPLLPHVSRFTLHTLPSNGGPAVARNRGIQEAKGEWIAFLDADDVWLPGKLELQMRLAVKHPEVALWCGKSIAFAEGEQELLSINGCSVIGNAAKNQERKTKNSLLEITLQDLAIHNPIGCSTVLVRKAAIEAVGGFDEQFCGPEDYDLWIRIAGTASPSMTPSPFRGEGGGEGGQNPENSPHLNPLPQGERKEVCKTFLTSGSDVYGLMSVASITIPLTLQRQRLGSLSMEDRTFLPQVMRVLNKAYGPGGALAPFQHLRKAAMSAQCWGGSWMAFSRGARWTALQLVWKAWRLQWGDGYAVEHPWMQMVIRYLCGTIPGSSSRAMGSEERLSQP